MLARAAQGMGSHVVGDPCIVRDESVGGWRMVLFFDPPGCGQSICRSVSEVGPGKWEPAEPLRFANQPAYFQTSHKPYIVQEARRPNHAAFIEGRFWLVSVAIQNGRKFIHRAWSQRLAGPWTWEDGPLIDTGPVGAFDEKHTDAVSGFFFPETNEILYFYMGYPRQPQARKISPLGNAQAVAAQKVGESSVRKLGMVLPPAQKSGHWAAGYVGGLQILPGKTHRWVGLVNASPTAPTAEDKAVSREEPPPSLAGFAVCDEEFPTSGWRWLDEPIEWIEQIPADRLADGEGVNLWRQHLLVLPDGRMGLFYNSGAYGKEQLYMRWAEA